ncbi:MAG: hypothetical protein R2854_24060 [Caldilineaceae bacterium]
MLQKSIAQYNLAVTLSPNTAHLWSERIAHLAEGDQEAAEGRYRHSLEIDPSSSRPTCCWRTCWTSRGAVRRARRCWRTGWPACALVRVCQETAAMYSYLGVARSRMGDVDGAIASNLRCWIWRPGMWAPYATTLLYTGAGQGTKRPSAGARRRWLPPIGAGQRGAAIAAIAG